MTYGVNYTHNKSEFQPLIAQGIEENAPPQLEKLKAARRAKKIRWLKKKNPLRLREATPTAYLKAESCLSVPHHSCRDCDYDAATVPVKFFDDSPRWKICCLSCRVESLSAFKRQPDDFAALHNGIRIWFLD